MGSKFNNKNMIVCSFLGYLDMNLETKKYGFLKKIAYILILIFGVGFPAFADNDVMKLSNTSNSDYIQKHKILVAEAKQNSQQNDVDSKRETIDLIWRYLKTTSSISEGEGSKEVYIFFDPFCIHCHLLWDKTRKFHNTKNHWVPIAELEKESKFVAAALIESGKVEDLNNVMSNIKYPTKKLNNDLQKQIDRNAHLLKKLNISSYPVVFFGEGDNRKIFIGAPDGDKLNTVFGPN